MMNRRLLGLLLGVSALLLLGSSEEALSRDLWVWTGEELIENRTRQNYFFEFCHNLPGTLDSIETIYLYPSRRPLNDRNEAFLTSLRAFLRRCHENGFRVEYLDGEPHWTTTGRDLGLGRIRAFAEFQNQTRDAAERFDGIQLDVEPYVLPGWPSAEIKSAFLRFLDDAKRILPRNTTFGSAIPYWYDDVDEAFLRDVMRRLDYAALMNYTDAGHEAVQYARGEISIAGGSCRVVVGLETQDVVSMRQGDDLTTFFEEGTAVMEENILFIDERLSQERAYGGVAVHCYESYRKLAERTFEESGYRQGHFSPVVLDLGRGNHRFPAVSPDGSRIAYQSDVSGNDEIYVYWLDGRASPVNLTNNPASDGQPCWSPAGDQIAFFSNRNGDGDIFIMNADGSNLRALTATPQHEENPAWSPDGDKIAYFRRGGNESPDLWVQPLRAPAGERLTNDAYFDYGPAWSPDGRSILYSSTREGKTNLYRLDVSSGRISRVTRRADFDFMPAYSADGSRMAYSSTENGKEQIYVHMNGNPVQVTDGNAENARPSWSPDGNFLVFHTQEGSRSRIRIINFTGGEPARARGWITSPLSSQTVSGAVTVKGVVGDLRNLNGGAVLAQAKEYCLQVRPAEGEGWTTLAEGRGAVSDAPLGVWNTRNFTDGEYMLRLKVSNGLINTVSDVCVRVRN